MNRQKKRKKINKTILITILRKQNYKIMKNKNNLLNFNIIILINKLLNKRHKNLKIQNQL